MCPAGAAQNASYTSSSDRTCISCELGVTFKPLAGNAPNCADVQPMDPTAQYISVAATLTSDRQLAMLTECNLTTAYISVLPTVTSNRACKLLKPCGGTTFYNDTTKTDTSDRVCQPLTVCDLRISFIR